MNTRLHFKNFTFNDASLGAMDIYGAWKNDMRAIFLDAHMEEEGVSKTHVIGHVYPLKTGKQTRLEYRDGAYEYPISPILHAFHC